MNKRTGQRALAFAVTALIGLLAAAPSSAIDYQPFDWLPLPPGTSGLLGYYEYGKHDAYNNTLTGTISQDTTLNANIEVARFIHYDEHLIFGHQWDFNVFVAHGSLTDGKIGGYPLRNASGVSDPIVSTGLWIINQPENGRWLSAADYVTLPVGTYNRDRPLNIGGHRWQNDLQADFMQAFPNGLSVDLSADWLHSGDNTEAGTGYQRLTQAASYGAYLWINYDVSDLARKVMAGWSHAYVSVGYAGTFGGAQELNGFSTGAKTDEQQVRLTYMMFVSPTWQGLLSVTHDVHVAGQFDQEFGLILRIAKLF